MSSVCVSESRSICEPAGSVKRPQHDTEFCRCYSRAGGTTHACRSVSVNSVSVCLLLSFLLLHGFYHVFYANGSHIEKYLWDSCKMLKTGANTSVSFLY